MTPKGYSPSKYELEAEAKQDRREFIVAGLMLLSILLIIVLDLLGVPNPFLYFVGWLGVAVPGTYLFSIIANDRLQRKQKNATAQTFAQQGAHQLWHCFIWLYVFNVSMAFFTVSQPYFRVLEVTNIVSPSPWSILGIIVLFGGGFGILLCVAVIPQYFFPLRRFERLRDLAAQHSDEVASRSQQAHENVKEWLPNQREKTLRPSLYQRLIELYYQIDQLPTAEISRRIEQAGISNPLHPWYGKGRSLEEGVLVVIHTARHNKEQAELAATQQAHAQFTRHAEVAPNLEKRKELERQREGAEQELRRLTGNRVKETYKLSAFGGECQVQYHNDEIEQLVLMVEAGEYSVKLLDVRKDSGDAKRAVIENDGAPHTLGGWASGFTKDDTELIVKKRGSEAEERKFLW